MGLDKMKSSFSAQVEKKIGSDEQHPLTVRKGPFPREVCVILLIEIDGFIYPIAS